MVIICSSLYVVWKTILHSSDFTAMLLLSFIQLTFTLLASSKNTRKLRTSTKNTKANNVKRTPRESSIHNSRLTWAKENDAIILIDVENVRGKSQFELTHQVLLKQITQWTNANDLKGRVALVVDHGSIQSAYSLQEAGLALVFAGPRLKADDILARDVGYFGKNAIVITADNDLMSRCRNSIQAADHDSAIQFIQPIKFISDLEILARRVDEKEEQQIASRIDVNEPELNGEEGGVVTDQLIASIDEEIKIRASMYETEMAMRQKKNMKTPKARRKLEKRARMLCERLAMKGGQNIDHLITLGGISTYDRRFQDEVLSQWSSLRKSAKRREMTGDRMLLAEFFRRQIESSETSPERNLEGTYYTDGYVQHVNDLIGSKAVTSLSAGGISASENDSNDDDSKSENRPLRIVVISDTHGFEESLTPGGTLLPKGDILLHLGDFAIDGPLKKKNKAIERFDEWLSQQPHRTKIVLRGNHDPFSCRFPKSNANFFSRPKSIAIDGKLTMTLVPYSSPRSLSSSWRKLPMYCDLLASHSPPHKILDKCYNGANAGCASLRGKVERMIAGPPKLWVCGHIHEGRGAKSVQFGMTIKETLVVNASNANPGRATCIKYGPVVVDVDQTGNDEITLLQGEAISIDSETTKELNVVA